MLEPKAKVLSTMSRIKNNKKYCTWRERERERERGREKNGWNRGWSSGRKRSKIIQDAELSKQQL